MPIIPPDSKPPDEPPKGPPKEKLEQESEQEGPCQPARESAAEPTKKITSAPKLLTPLSGRGLYYSRQSEPTKTAFSFAYPPPISFDYSLGFPPESIDRISSARVRAEKILDKKRVAIMTADDAEAALLCLVLSVWRAVIKEFFHFALRERWAVNVYETKCWEVLQQYANRAGLYLDLRQDLVVRIQSSAVWREFRNLRLKLAKRQEPLSGCTPVHKRGRGRPNEISPQRKEEVLKHRAEAATRGKKFPWREAAKILYDVRNPTPQQVDDSSNVIKYYLKTRKSISPE